VSAIAASTIALYVLLNLAYSAGLKHVPYLDVLILASGYVLRVLAGTEGLAIPISEWMLIVAFFGALMIGLGKRSAESTLHGSRPSTKGISASDLKLMTLAAATLTIANVRDLRSSPPLQAHAPHDHPFHDGDRCATSRSSKPRTTRPRRSSRAQRCS
jgi:hypothetical protein